MMTNDTEEVDPVLGISLEEGLRELEKAREKTRAGRLEKRDGRICACGHAVARHFGRPGKMLCKPTAMECPCQQSMPVLEAQDLRKFTWSTTGIGTAHALAKGVHASRVAERKYEWLESARCCFECGRETAPLTPVAISAARRVSTEPETINGLVCEICLKAVL